MVKSAPSAWCPEYGDLICIDFNPQAGREQSGRRPALVMSERLYNEKTSLVMACLLTSKPKGYRYEVPITSPLNKPGVVLTNHLRSMDWRLRKAEWIGKAPLDVMAEARARLKTLMRLH